MVKTYFETAMETMYLVFYPIVTKLNILYLITGHADLIGAVLSASVEGGGGLV
jgi:hypothetical protein